MARRYVLIGSGVASVTAAETIQQHDAAAQITVVGDDPHGYYSRPGLAYVLNRTIPESQIYPYPVERLKAVFPHRVHARAHAVAPAEHEVILEDGRRLPYDRLLIATGARSITPDFPGNDLAGLVKLNTLADVQAMARLSRRGRHAIVIGGGIIAIELAEGLAARGMQVRYFLRGERYWASVLDKTESRLVERGLEQEGIRLHYQTQVARAGGRHGAIESVTTRAGETFPCSVLGSAIGLESNMEVAQRSGLATDKGILVDEYLESSAPDVFAAGDVAQVRDPHSGAHWLETLWPVARRQGELAGRNMAGVRTVCERQVAFNVFRIGGITTATIGAVAQGRDDDLVTVSSENRSHWSAESDAWISGKGDRVNRVRILIDRRAIVGAVVMGDQSLARPLQSLIRAKADITSIHAHLERAQDDPARSFELITAFHRQWERQRAAA